MLAINRDNVLDVPNSPPTFTSCRLLQCGASAVPASGQCQCPDGSTVAEQVDCPLACPDGQELVNGTCLDVCSTFFARDPVTLECVPDPQCPGEVDEAGQCNEPPVFVCPPDHQTTPTGCEYVGPVISDSDDPYQDVMPEDNGQCYRIRGCFAYTEYHENLLNNQQTPIDEQFVRIQSHVSGVDLSSSQFFCQVPFDPTARMTTDEVNQYMRSVYAAQPIDPRWFSTNTATNTRIIRNLNGSDPDTGDTVTCARQLCALPVTSTHTRTPVGSTVSRSEGIGVLFNTGNYSARLGYNTTSRITDADVLASRVNPFHNTAPGLCNFSCSVDSRVISSDLTPGPSYNLSLSGCGYFDDQPGDGSGGGSDGSDQSAVVDAINELRDLQPTDEPLDPIDCENGEIDCDVANQLDRVIDTPAFGTLNTVFSVTVPASSCPPLVLDLPEVLGGSTITEDMHCDLANEYETLFSAVLIASYLFIGLYIALYL